MNGEKFIHWFVSMMMSFDTQTKSYAMETVSTFINEETPQIICYLKLNLNRFSDNRTCGICL